MSAILFGSISTIADTSELQRQAFNQAFKAHGLDWNWSQADYLVMLEKSGGQNRINDYADSILQGSGSANGQTVDTEAIHRSKSEFFQNSLTKSQIEPRFGVVETIQSAKIQGLKIAFVTTTTRENISLLISALHLRIQVSDFDLILNAELVDRPKPDKAAYTFALERLGEKSADCIAIEDNLAGVESAIAAGINCIAFPNQNTAHHDFDRAKHLVDRLDFDELQKFLVSK
ncbi:HAD-IA family hydrolase [Chamaesiphon sp. VAR_69_metabat_338]|uniref:HAD family hydrolase n=1 Tax=Chamaesiphon sp. VAR_69_metabat_338 TaxID=2964704 RepID=UPI00286EA8FB|nr:HAD-IA family hydrolase [Chamaesiphon sp. VAR_69_metabat_338]